MFGNASNDSTFVTSVYKKLISDELSQNIQWKGSPRLNDGRIGISNFCNVVAAIGGIF